MKSKKVIDKFNQKANQWLNDLRQMDEDEIHIKPSPTSWCIAEVYDHVMRVGRNYQIPNLKQSISETAKRKKRKNKYGIALFNFGVRKQVHITMEKFPQPLIDVITPAKRSKTELVNDLLAFIKEVNELQGILESSDKNNKHNHPMFGDINTLEWFSLIEIHFWHHEKQVAKIKEFVGRVG